MCGNIWILNSIQCASLPVIYLRLKLYKNYMEVAQYLCPKVPWVSELYDCDAQMVIATLTRQGDITKQHVSPLN